MSCRLRATLVALLWLAVPVHVRAEESRTLSLVEVRSLARAHAPEARLARAQIAEARAQGVGAAVLLRENPKVGAAVGSSIPEAGLALELELTQGFELGARRSARVAGARAGLDRAEAEADEAVRSSLRAASLAFFRALYAQETVRLGGRAAELAELTLQTAEKRHRAGDVPVLHVSLARGALARARSDGKAAEAALAEALGELRLLTGLSSTSPITLAGSLAAEPPPTEPGEPRPELRVAKAGRAQALAEQDLAAALAWPDLELGARYTQESDAASVLGLVTVSLPFFERGQGARAEAAAREARARLEQEALGRRIELEQHTAREVYQRRTEAVAELRSSLPLREQDEALARRSYELGELGLAELLLVRSEALQTHSDLLGRQLEAAIAAVELEAATGALR